MAGGTPAPVSTPKLDQPKQTATQGADPGESHGPSSDRKQKPTQGSSPADGSSNDEESVNIPYSGQPHIAKSRSPGGDPGTGIDQGGQPSIVATVAGEAATLLPGIIAIGSTTLARGDPPITISGTVMSLGSTALVVASKALPLPQSQQVMTNIDGNAVTFVPDAVVIAGKTLQAGDPPLTLSGMVLSISSPFLVMGSETIDLRQTQHVTVLNGNTPVTATEGNDPNHRTAIDGTSFHGTPVSLASNGDLYIGDTLLKPGGTAVKINGTPLSLAPDGNLVINYTTSEPGGAGITMHRTPITVAADGALVLDGTTLKPGATGITIDGASPDTHLLVNGLTLKPGGAATTVHGVQLSLAPDGNLLLNGTTLSPGSAAITLDGTPVSLAPSGDILMSGTALGSEDAGVTIDGIPMSVASNGDWVIGTAAGSAAGGLGAVINERFGRGPTKGSLNASNFTASSVLVFEGKAARLGFGSWSAAVVLVGFVVLVGIM